MKTIAYWSRSHKNAARLTIAGCHLIIFYLACYIGIELQKGSYTIPISLFYISTLIFLGINIGFYQYYKSYSFNLRKLLDGLVLCCAFVMIICTSNKTNQTSLVFYSSVHGSFGEKEVKTAVPVSKPSFKEIKKQFKELKKMARDGKASAGGIILAILVGMVLSLLVASASCSIACNDQGALALLVLLAGLTGVFFVCKLIIKGTRRKDKYKPAETTEFSGNIQ